jgi:hypothetical protein
MGKILKFDINLNSNCPPKTKNGYFLVFSSLLQQKILIRKIRVNTSASCVVERIEMCCEGTQMKVNEMESSRNWEAHCRSPLQVANGNGIWTVLDVTNYNNWSVVTNNRQTDPLKKIYERVKRYYSEWILTTERGRLVNKNDVGCDLCCQGSCMWYRNIEWAHVLWGHEIRMIFEHDPWFQLC